MLSIKCRNENPEGLTVTDFKRTDFSLEQRGVKEVGRDEKIN